MFSVYDAAGNITRHIVCRPNDIGRQVMPDERYVDGRFDPAEWFVLDGIPEKKRVIEAVVSGHTISNLPVPCVATIEDRIYTIGDGVLEVEFYYPGAYRVMLSAPGYADLEVNLEN